MTFRSFLRDRRLYILIYAGFSLLTITIIQLDLWISGSSLQLGNILYVLLFGLIGLGIFLSIEYRRQAIFFEEFSKRLVAESLDQMAMLNEPVTLEQQLYAGAWARLYAHLRAKITDERQRGKRRVHLLSQWAHHMKTPVAVVDLELQKARQMAPSPGIEAIIKSVSEENERLSHSLQMLLNVTRLDDFASDFRVESIDLLSLLRQVVNEHRRAFISHRVYPKIEAPDPDSLPNGLLCVESDSKWLRLVFEQILDNAIKYAARSDREGQVCIRFQHESEIILEIADDGIGIAPEDLGRVFTPFFTGSTGRQYSRSTGMGLYLAHEVCHQLGHRLTIYSRPGEGTQVRIHFQRDRSIFASLKNSMTGK